MLNKKSCIGISLVTLAYLKHLRFSHLSIYGNNVDNFELVNVRHGKCIIIEWEVVYKESNKHNDILNTSRF